MLDDTTKAAFIRDGLVHYPGARETVDYFQTTILESIQKAFEEKDEWKNFKPHRQGGTSSMGRLSVQLIGHSVMDTRNDSDSKRRQSVAGTRPNLETDTTSEFPGRRGLKRVDR